jgi:sulfopyruvate decarboxylase subunit beta
MLIQSSGVGNTINALCSLTKFYQLPLPILVSWRGVYDERIAAQIPMGKYLPKLLDALEIGRTELADPRELSAVEDILGKVFEENTVHAFLLNPKLWGENMRGMENIVVERKELEEQQHKVLRIRPHFTRFQLMEAAVPYLEGKAVVCNLGYPCKELYHLKHQKSNFYMLGSMGMASAVGLGIALNTQKEVVVVEGDGSILMNPSTLATTALTAPRNLTLLVFDNGVYGSTGNQPTAANGYADLELVARGFGIKNTYKVATKDQLHRVLEELGEGPNFIHAVAKPGNVELPNVPLSSREIKENVVEFLKS